MAYTNQNTAYDLSLFEPANAKKKKPVEDEKKSRVIKLESVAKPQKAKAITPTFVITAVLSIGIVVGGIVALLCGYARLTELNQKVVEATASLAEQESIYIQNEMKVEAELSPEVVEDYAVNVLGMVKADSSKKEFIKLSDGDKALVADGSDRRFGDYLLESIATLW